MGLGYDGVMVSLYEDYSSYIDHKKAIQSHAFLELGETESFVVSLNDKVRYRHLTLSALARYLLAHGEKTFKEISLKNMASVVDSDRYA